MATHGGDGDGDGDGDDREGGRPHHRRPDHGGREQRRQHRDRDRHPPPREQREEATTTTTTAHHCLICYSSRLDERRTASPCGHDDVCWACHLQMRYLHSDRKCPVCKAENETLIVADASAAAAADDGGDAARTRPQRKKFADYPMWGDEVVGGKYVRREDAGMHFPTGLYDAEVSPLLGYGCGMPHCEYNDDGDIYVCEGADDSKGSSVVDPKRPQRGTKKRLAGLPALKSHLRIEHGYTLCDLCADNKRDFVSKLARYTPRGLKDHQARGDGDDSGFRGHPLCEFCRPSRFYDVVKLHEHLNREHYKCHVCDKSGKPNVFFKDYDNLERHFDRDHYLCRDPQCLAARFVVFENDIDLRGHEVCVHGKTSNGGNSKIRLEFRVRREGDENTLRDHQSVPTGDDFQYGLDGEAFVPEALPDQRERSSAATTRQANEREITHPVHAARTAELREQAARVRARDGIVAGGGMGAGGGIAAAGEAFPALGATTDASPDGTVMLVGWTSDGVRAVAGGGGYGGGGRAGRPGGLSRTSAGGVTEEEFPSLGGPSSSSGGRVVGHLGRTRTRPTAATAATGLRFSAAAASSSRSTTTTTAAIARPTSSSSASSSSSSFGRFVPSALTTLSSSSFRAAPVPNLTSADNFPSLLGGVYGSSSSSSSSSAATTTASARPNPYAAVRAHARKLNNGGGGILAPSFAPSDFPPPPPPSSSNAAKNARIVDAFAPKKKPPPLNDTLQFPPPSLAAASSSSSSSLAAKKAPPPPPSAESLEAGRETVQSLKQLLGAARFKRLRTLTRDVACGAIPPERYVDGAASLFDRGIGDAAFWESIPPLIRDIPNAAAADSAVVYLESIRMANEMQELEFGSGTGGGGGKKPINFVLPTATTKKKMTNSWGN